VAAIFAAGGAFGLFKIHGIVQTQDPPGGTQAAPGKVVTIAVGKFGAPTTPGPP